jgi:hypothetical protein
LISLFLYFRVFLSLSFKHSSFLSILCLPPLHRFDPLPLGMSLQNTESVFAAHIDTLHDLKCKVLCGGVGVNSVACSASRQCALQTEASQAESRVSGGSRYCIFILIFWKRYLILLFC